MKEIIYKTDKYNFYIDQMLLDKQSNRIKALEDFITELSDGKDLSIEYIIQKFIDLTAYFRVNQSFTFDESSLLADVSAQFRKKLGILDDFDISKMEPEVGIRSFYLLQVIVNFFEDSEWYFQRIESLKQTTEL